MVKPTMMQTLLGRPSQKYSFPSEQVYYSTKQDMVRIAAEATSSSSTTGIVANTPHIERAKPHQRPHADMSDTTSEQQRWHPNANDGDSDSENEVFYTPYTSPRDSIMSMGSLHAAVAATPSAPSTSLNRVMSTKTSLTHANTSTTSISSSSLDAHSLFSVALSDVTLMTTPPQSDSSRRTAAETAGDKAPVDKLSFIPTPPAKSTTTPRRSHTVSHSIPQPPSKPQYRKQPNTTVSKNFSKNTPSIMTSMAALLEEEELLEEPVNLHLPRPSVLITPPKRGAQKAPIVIPVSNPSKPRLPHKRSRSLGFTTPSAPRVSSPLCSNVERPPSRPSSTSSHTSSRKSSNSGSRKPPAKYASASADPYDPSTTSLPAFTTGDLPSHGTPGFTSLVLPRTPVPLSQTSQGKGIFDAFSTHVNDTNIDGKVDLTRSGMAQTTMASIEVVRGLSGNVGSATLGRTPSKKLMGLFRRGSASSPTPPPSSNSRERGQSLDGGRRKPSEGRSLDLGAGENPLGFTSYRTPPQNVPSGSILVQVWAVGIDGVDRQLVFGSSSSSSGNSTSKTGARPNDSPIFSTPQNTPKRSASLRSTLGRFGGGASAPSSPVSSPGSNSGSGATTGTAGSTPPAGVGYIPGRSFVGRVLECGWDVSEEDIKRGDWVVGLLDVKKCGALTEFIVCDRHRVHRVPHPRMDPIGLFSPPAVNGHASPSFSSSRTTNIGARVTPSSSQHGHTSREQSPLTLEELSLLPVCGIPAYRAVRTFAFTFSTSDSQPGSRSGSTEGGWDFGSIDSVSAQEQMSAKARGKQKDSSSSFSSSPSSSRRQERLGGKRRRALVLRGHDGPGAMAVQMLVKQGWRVCVHAPFSALSTELLDPALSDSSEDEKERARMRIVEERIRGWGGEEVIFDDGDVDAEAGDCVDERGAVVRVIDRLREDGDIFDAVLDTVGGRGIWEAAERLLKSSGGTFTSPNGTNMTRKRAGPDADALKQFTTLVGDMPGRAIPTAGDHFKAGLRSLNLNLGRRDGKSRDGNGSKVGYAWVNLAQDVDWEGEDVRETLEAVLGGVIKDGVRPWVGHRIHGTQGNGTRAQVERMVPFERAPEAFVNGSGDVLAQGGTVVVKVAG